MGAQQPEATTVEQVLAIRVARGVQRQDIHPAQHGVEVRVPGRAQLRLHHRRQPVTIVIVDGKPERAGAARHRLADAPHADDAQRLAADPVAEHPARAPAGPSARADQLLALRQPARDRHDQRHGHVGGILGQDARRVGDDDAARPRRAQVDMVHARAEIGDQPEPRAGGGEHARVDRVGDGRHQHVAVRDRVAQPRHIKRPIVAGQRRVEQRRHPLGRRIGQLAGDSHLGVRTAAGVGHGRRAWRKRPPRVNG